MDHDRSVGRVIPFATVRRWPDERRSADNAVVDGIRTTSSFMAAGDLLIDPQCTALIEEIPGYAWDDKATEHGKDEPLKIDDHGCDAMRYGCMAAASLWYSQVGRQAA